MLLAVRLLWWRKSKVNRFRCGHLIDQVVFVQDMYSTGESRYFGQWTKPTYGERRTLGLFT
jgi:hypothetical protein